MSDQTEKAQVAAITSEEIETVARSFHRTWNRQDTARDLNIEVARVDAVLAESSERMRVAGGEPRRKKKEFHEMTGAEVLRETWMDEIICESERCIAIVEASILRELAGMRLAKGGPDGVADIWDVPLAIFDDEGGDLYDDRVTIGAGIDFILEERGLRSITWASFPGKEMVQMRGEWLHALRGAYKAEEAKRGKKNGVAAESNESVATPEAAKEKSP